MVGSTISRLFRRRERLAEHIRRKRLTPAHFDEHRGTDLETSRRLDICSLQDHLQSRSISRALICQRLFRLQVQLPSEAGRRAAAAEPLGSDTAARCRGRSIHLLNWFQAAVVAHIDLKPICKLWQHRSVGCCCTMSSRRLSRRTLLPLLQPS